MSRKVLVTGGSGLLGAALVHQLTALTDTEVHVLDIVESPARLDGLSGRIEYLQGDAGDAATLERIVGIVKPDAIYHLAALLGSPCEDDPLAAMRINADGTLFLLEAARVHGVQQVLFASSVTTMGLDLAEAVHRDNTLQRPASFYGVTKLFCEGAGRFYRRRYGLDFRAIRYPAIVGPGLRQGGLINYTAAMIYQSLAGQPCVVPVAPDTRISLVHVEDAARALIMLAQAPIDRIQTLCYLIDGLDPVPSAGEMANLVRARIEGARIEFIPNPQWQALLGLNALPVDDSPARKEWNWRPEYRTYEAIIDSFRELNH